MPLNYYEKQQLPSPLINKKNKYYLKEKDPLIAAFNVALHLGMPLLLTGEPGTGKTKFAHHIAERFDLGQPLVFNVKTSSLATDLYYRYDAIRHYHLTHHGKIEEEGEDFLDKKIIQLEAMGLAIKKAGEDKKRSVVLIDEIDKAARDFPNDLLNELERETLGFSIPEWGGKSYQAADASLKPMVIITSNSEKNLPEPFLRRCVYYHIDFPSDSDTLLEIVQGQLSSDFFSERDLKALIAAFKEIRVLADKKDLKKPATAELVAWILVLQAYEFNIADLKKPDSSALIASYSVLAKDAALKKYLLEQLEKNRKA